MTKEIEPQIDLTEAFQAVQDLEQKCLTVAAWVDAYFKEFTQSSHGQQWEWDNGYYEPKDDEEYGDDPDLSNEYGVNKYGVFSGSLWPKDKSNFERLRTEINIEPMGLVSVRLTMEYGETIKKYFQIEEHSLQSAFARVILEARDGYWDELTETLRKFNAEKTPVPKFQYGQS